MKSPERLIRTWMISSRDEEVNDLVTAITSDEITLLGFVKALGDYLTSAEDGQRTKGLELLSAVIKETSSEKLRPQHVRILTNFYCAKLDDIHTIIPALHGLTALCKLPTFTGVDAITVVQGFFAHVKMKGLTQAVRFLVYSILDAIMASHRQALKSLGAEFLDGYLSLVQGEKDPRNLLVAFALGRVIILEFDISRHVESFYDITFSYFPITFRPPPNDPYGITTEDLRNRLRECLNATPSFGPLAIPLFLEKLVAGSPAIKRDTLQTMAACFPVYGPGTARSFAKKLWNAIKLEIFQPVDDNLEEEALKATQILITTIYSNGQEEDAEITGLARDACEECIQILKEPEKSQAKHAIKVICAFFSTTPSVSKYALSQTITHLTTIFRNPDETLTRTATLTLLGEIISATRNNSSTPVIGGASPKPALAPYKDDILAVLVAGLKVPAAYQPALKGLRVIIDIPNLLADEEVGFVVHNANELLRTTRDEDELAWDLTLDLLAAISIINHRHIVEQTLPFLFASLPNNAPDRYDTEGRISYWVSLQALKKLCLQSELFETLVVRLTTKLDLIWPKVTNEEGEPAAAYAHALLKVLATNLSEKVERGHPDIAKYVDRLLPRLFNMALSAVLAQESGTRYNIDLRILEVIAKIITLVVQSLPVKRQQSYVDSIFKAFIDGDIGLIAEGHQKLPVNIKFQPLQAGAPVSHKDLLTLFASVITPLHKEVTIPVPNLSKFLQNVLFWAQSQADSEVQQIAAWHIMSGIINKHGDEVQDFLTIDLTDFWKQEIQDTSRPLVSRQRAIVAWGWISKALVVRSNSISNTLIGRLFELFSEEGINWQAAKVFGQIGSVDDVLTKGNHTVLRVLYSQRYVLTVLPRILSGAKDVKDATAQTAYLVALTSLIKSIPKATYLQELSSLVPLLLRGLELPDPEIRVNVIGTFQAAAQNEEADSGSAQKQQEQYKEIISQHAGTLVNLMLNNSSVQEMPAVLVRVAALKYLAVIPEIVPYSVLHPQKLHVLRELSKALDDPKRTVRKEAVAARTNWLVFSVIFGTLGSNVPVPLGLPILDESLSQMLDVLLADEGPLQKPH